MARFKYLGEIARPSVVKVYGPCEGIRIPKNNGTYQTIMGPPGGFVIGNDIGVDIVDERSLIAMRADPRFAQI